MATRGHVRVMGLAKTAPMTMLTVMAVNLRLLDPWTNRQEQAAAAAGKPKVARVTRTPRRRTRLLLETRAHLEDKQAAMAAVIGRALVAVPDHRPGRSTEPPPHTVHIPHP